MACQRGDDRRLGETSHRWRNTRDGRASRHVINGSGFVDPETAEAVRGAWADLFHPRPATVAQPVDDLGPRAVELLLDRIADPGLPPRHVRLETTLRPRISNRADAGLE
jgi:Periplasmic binding protein-like domain